MDFFNTSLNVRDWNVAKKGLSVMETFVISGSCRDVNEISPFLGFFRGVDW